MYTQKEGKRGTSMRRRGECKILMVVVFVVILFVFENYHIFVINSIVSNRQFKL